MKPLASHTLYELQILPFKLGEKSILDLLNRAHTYPGKDKLKTLLSAPLTSVAHIEKRQRVFQFFAEHLSQLNIEIPPGYLTAAQNHLISNLVWTSAKSRLTRYQLAQWLRWFRPYDYYQIQSGTAALQQVLQLIDQQTASWRSQSQLPGELQPVAHTLQTFFSQIRHLPDHSSSRAALLQVDYALRHQYADQVKSVLDLYYQLDAYCGIARFLATVQWSYPQFVQEGKPTFRAASLKHPLLDPDKAVGNNYQLLYPQQLSLLTGGNMSGKTTFLKTCGLVVYLAHVGLPVPARSVHLSFFDCLLTSIHLSDSLERGYSHFYTELIRIKAVAEAISLGHRVLLLADELFRGTNPDDALQCGQMVITKFLQQPGSLFMISSHLPQLGATYQGNEQVQFSCFQTQVTESKLVFSYRLEPGTVTEQTGLLLLNQTGVLASLT